MINKVKIEICGKNINNYINRLIKENIMILSLKIVNYNKAILVIYYKDYLKLDNRRTIYKIRIIRKYGGIRLVYRIKKGYIFIISFVIGIFLICFLSNIIFDVSVIHSSSEIKSLVYYNLDKYGLKKYSFKKSYNEIDEIEDKILEENKKKLEWLEIEVVGTKYIVRVEERKVKVPNNDKLYQSIVMGKSGVLRKIVAYSGEKLKEINSFQKMDTEIISGKIVRPNGEVINVHASGKLYAEVWYKIKVTFPYHYKEEKLTGRSKTVYYIKFINKRIGLFDFKRFNSFQKEPLVITSNLILPISFIKEKQYEVNIIDEIYTYEEVIDHAIKLGEEKLLSSNEKIEKIDNVSVMKQVDLGKSVELELFVSVIEDVTKIEYIEIDNDM